MRHFLNSQNQLILFKNSGLADLEFTSSGYVRHPEHLVAWYNHLREFTSSGYVRHPELDNLCPRHTHQFTSSGYVRHPEPFLRALLRQ